jgi:hypothetical protein
MTDGLITRRRDALRGVLDVASSSLDVGGDIARVIAQLLHQGDVDRIGIGGQDVHQSAVGGITDGSLLVV